MGKFIAALAALIILVAAIVVLAPNLIPAKTYKGRLEAAASTALGRTVSLGDDISFKIIPQTAFSVGDLVIANAPGFEGDYLAKVKRADIGVKLMPLFSGRVEISRFVLSEPDLNLQKAADGAVNWNLAASNAPADGVSGAGAVKEISLGDVRLTDGRAVYADAAAKKTYTAEDIDMTARLASLSEPLELDGTMKLQGAPATVNIVLTNLADVLAKKQSNLKLDLKLGDATIGADLALAAGEVLGYSGPVSLDAPNLPALASLFDVKLEDAPGFDRLSVSGQATGTPQSLNLSGAEILFDAIDANGDLKLDWSKAKPMATGNLAAGSLDLRPYMPPPATSAQGFPAWSTEKIDFSSLRNLDANLDLSAGKVFLNDMEAGESRLNLKIDNGRMTASIPQLGFYGGGGSGTLVVDARQSTPAIAGKFAMNSVEAQPFTIDLMKLDKLLGLGGFNIEFNATGSSQAAIMQSLDGKGGFDLNDGAIKGVNIVKLANAVAKLYEGGLANPAAVTAAVAEARRADEKTDFSKFLSNFTITNGDMQAPTISLEGPYLAMSGVGRVNLPGQTLDLRLLPRASTSADGKTGRKIAIPLKVGGSFSKPTMSIDVESLVKGKAEQTVRGLLDKALKPKEGEEADPAAGLLEGILGGSRPATGAAEPTTGAVDGPTGASATKPAAKDPTEALINQGIGAIFGKKKKPAEEPKEEEAEPN
ncbi:MAG: AsmA family protein [Pseudomonadota bacterium]